MCRRTSGRTKTNFFTQGLPGATPMDVGHIGPNFFIRQKVPPLPKSASSRSDRVDACDFDPGTTKMAVHFSPLRETMPKHPQTTFYLKNNAASLSCGWIESGSNSRRAVVEKDLRSPEKHSVTQCISIIIDVVKSLRRQQTYDERCCHSRSGGRLARLG